MSWPGALALGLGLSVFLPALSAQLPQPRLWTIYPAGGQIGTEVEVGVSGADLDDPVALFPSNEKVVIEPKLDGDGNPVKHRFVIKLPEDLSPGRYEIWAQSRYGVSNSRLFAVGNRRQFVDRTPAHDRADAVPVSLGLAVQGRSVANRKNYYRFFASGGRQLVIECQGKSLDSQLDPILELFDGKGRLLIKDRRGHRLLYRTTVSGTFYVAVRDLTYRGGESFFYQLAIHDEPQIEGVLPLSGPAGEEREFHLFGYNLPSGDNGLRTTVAETALERVVFRQTVPAAGNGSLAGMPHSVAGHEIARSFPWPDRDASFVPRIGITSLDTIVETERSDGQETPQSIELPVSVSGTFFPEHDRDVYEFDARKDERYRIEVKSQQLGYGTSPMVLVEALESGGKTTEVLVVSPETRNLGYPFLPLLNQDPEAWLTIPKDGRYRLTVHDRFNVASRRTGLYYELRLRPPTPDFRVVSVVDSSFHRKPNNQARVESLALAPGQILPVRLRLNRFDDFKGEVRIVAEQNLEDVKVHSPVIRSGTNEEILLLEAGADAKPALGFLKLFAEATVAGQEVTRPVEHGQKIWNVGDYRNETILTRLSPHRAIAVGDRQPFPIRIAVAEHLKIPIFTTVATRLTIPLTVDRLEGFNEAYQFLIRGLKALEKHPGVNFPKGASEGTLKVDLTQYQLPPGTHRFYLFGEIKGKYQRKSGGDAKDLTVSAYSAPISLEVLPAPFTIQFPQESLSVVSGKTLRTSIAIKRYFEFEGQIEVDTKVVESDSGLLLTSSMLRDGKFDLILDSISGRTGQVTVELRAQGKLNGKEVATKRTIPVKLVAAPQDD